MAKQKIDFAGIAIKTVSAAAGGFAAANANQIEVVAKQKGAVRGGVKMAVGAVLPFLAEMLLKSKKPNPAVQSFGDGMIAVGAVELANATVMKDTPAVLSGVDQLPTLGAYDQYQVAGSEQENVRQLSTLGAIPGGY